MEKLMPEAAKILTVLFSLITAMKSSAVQCLIAAHGMRWHEKQRLRDDLC
jgi:hypothetical protein